MVIGGGYPVVEFIKNKSIAIKKSLISITVIMAVIIGCFGIAEASWLINAKEFHASAHGQFSCTECHEDIAESEMHPDPSNVSKNRIESFDPQSCANCHDSVLDDLDENMHASREVKDPDSYQNCLRCHDVHTLPSQNIDAEFKADIPRWEQCGACHDLKSELPFYPEEDSKCVSCHFFDYSKKINDKESAKMLCLSCHESGGEEAKKITGKKVSLISKSDYQKTPHSEIACLTCHPQAANYSHDQQERTGNCTECHLPYHAESVAHDAHINVSCEACHLSDVKPAKKTGSDIVYWERIQNLKKPLSIHNMVMYESNKDCARCHQSGTDVGAVSMVLPAKSIICMPCHTSTFSVFDTVTIISLLVFILGLVSFFAYWLTATMDGVEENSCYSTKLKKFISNILKTVFSKKILGIAKALFFDVLCQRRLYKVSPTRWLIHSIIFLPFVFRCIWGLVALICSSIEPNCQWVWDMINKNHPLTAFLYDISGILILIGIACAILRGQAMRLKANQPSDLPNQDIFALLLIGGIVALGFILEAMRIAMTGWPDGSGFSFIGYSISIVFGGWATSIYGYVWYLHAILTGIFIAYLPFSRLSHIIMTPFVLAANATEDKHHN